MGDQFAPMNLANKYAYPIKMITDNKEQVKEISTTLLTVIYTVAEQRLQFSI